VLEPLALPGLHVGKNNTTVKFDKKHLTKSLRQREKGAAGMVIGDIMLTPSTLQRFMEMMKVPNIASLFNPNDKTNVPVSVLMGEHLANLRLLASHPEPWNPSMHRTWQAAVLLLHIDCCLLSVFDKEADLKSRMSDLSCFALPASYPYTRTKQRIKFIPSMLYHDLQA